FREISGYKLNLNKSELFPISTAARNYPLYSLPFKIAHHFTYLGVSVTSKFEDLLKANFVSLLSKVREDCERWSILNLSLTARVNTVKMNILPRFSYLFQCIPIFLPQSFFQKVDSVISEFIWNKKVPRLRKQYLQRPRKLGGLALPHFRFYYWASNIRILKYWLQSEPSDAQINWLAIEANSVKPTSLRALVHSAILSSTLPYTKNRIVRTTLRIWVQFKRYFGLQTSSTYAPLAANHQFPPSLVDDLFSMWSKAGIHSFKDLYIDNVFETKSNAGRGEYVFWRAWCQLKSGTLDRGMSRIGTLYVTRMH
uniref:Reverse transcriptase n=1 Tax=Denticeps clupeoides TaxID=299321 RepID=A0AAY4CWH0_9TELE